MQGSLAAKLTALKNAGVIDDRLHDWSAVVRDFGNSGAHDVDATLNYEDADDAIAFFEALVHYLYTFEMRGRPSILDLRGVPALCVHGRSMAAARLIGMTSN
ncbi:hypothetical protein FB382_003743 [Nocardioides ginsengisegetis]|uniref:DUF4145 domain-containing protein n=1 Tax=Nocardioides ginsengisegetis TaxID=661491 RepID=A0A7W3PBF7_9ACTN|nr:hypothetical protein [Nocardioides ginsengisegetis]